jgi:stalled ribosome rescue protein Dom34
VGLVKHCLKEILMKKDIGLWIDHRKTIIVSLTAEIEETKQIESEAEKHLRFPGGAPAATAEDMRDRRFENHLNKYYESIIAQIREADSILILGPGEAKVELKKRLESIKLGGRIVAIETVGKLTEQQIAAKVRQRFQ